MSITKKSQRPKHKKLYLISGLFVLIALVIVIGIVELLRYQTNNQISKVRNEFKQYYAEELQFSTLPSTATKTQVQWNSYYSGYISQFQTLEKHVLGNNVSNQSLKTFDGNFYKALTDNVNLLTLMKNYIDTSYQIESDQSTISSDQSTLQLDTSQDNQNCALSQSNPYITCDYSLEDQAKATLISDESQLTSDQQTYQKQGNQIVSLVKQVKADNNKCANEVPDLQPISYAKI